MEGIGLVLELIVAQKHILFSMRITQSIPNHHFLTSHPVEMVVAKNRCKRDLSKVKDEVNSLTVWVPSELPDLLRALVEGSKHEDGRLCIDLYVKRSISGKTM